MTPPRRFSPAELEDYAVHNHGVTRARQQYTEFPVATGRILHDTTPCTVCANPTIAATGVCRACTGKSTP